MSSFWSGWVIVLTLVTIALTTWLLFANRKSDLGGQTTGHAHDGIEEYDNPLPAWWFWMFVITIVFAIGYLLAFPGFGNFPGLLGWSQEQRYEREIQLAEERYGPLYEQYLATPIEQLYLNQDAMKMAGRLFANECSQCHGADARGSYGFPNLTDEDWIWGGSPEQIKTTLINGRVGAMVAWNTVLNARQIEEVSHYTLSLSGGPADPELAAAGQSTFNTFCIACHLVTGEGMPALGAPNLTDDIWLYGGTVDWIKQTVTFGRAGVMPAQGGVLSDAKIHLLTAYVYGLSRRGDEQP